MVRTEDERTVLVQAATGGQDLVGRTTKRGSFKMQDPPEDSTTSLIIAKDVSVTFQCTSSTPWYICKWKNPISDVPCSIIAPGNSQICHQWSNPNGG